MTQDPALIGVFISGRTLSAWSYGGDGEIIAAHSGEAGSADSATDGASRTSYFLNEWLGEMPACPIIVAGASFSPQAEEIANTVSVPCRTDAITAGLVSRHGLHFVPGIKQTSPPDFLLGSETSLFGIEETDGLVCMPGRFTHHIAVEHGRIVGITTEMTVSLMQAVLKEQHHTEAQIFSGAVFREWAEKSLDTENAVSPFAVHAACRIGKLKPQLYQCALAGLMIGADIAAHYEPGDDVILIADGDLLDQYGLALEILGAEIIEYSTEETRREGLLEIAEVAGLLDE
ncbi:2-dehydro-3-deoxygalactonokinase [Hyphomonas pacifica]|uniref:2-dehydro-3-deoxygalactonokinase n=1 Tax=Hyphomonas pacifica TaxID=1280941 RepID=A0A062U3M7_9PROT|nr:2-dehydro-3-deoxygalactonokinase [Hyphomonas pacifica]KCZ50740.1 hypothetical protein HY2_02485 [Hyphomonas pacifica]RAN31020.1 hypothetical protein HY3_05320 [Hyphomonas pacifica]RAN34958.1 hypothetical protein HY11_02885 [Hyphomonas pacifica]